jgi:hypothetical protein
MGKISFQLVEASNCALIRESNTLYDIWWFIKTTINEPRSYEVQQVDEDGDVEDCTSAYYLVERFKRRESLPQLLTDINDNI